MSYKEYKVKVFDNGEKQWFFNGERHREDGPAIEADDGSKYWYLNGKLHRADGPAAECTDGRKFWYLNGKEYTEIQYNAAVKGPSCEGKCVEIDGIKYKLTAV